ncbi:hypothetical protein [Streptomyces sp. NBC_00057]|uniref:hypothetical protein n=1 Tax=Streptomyces sp. NBC_00057 TaxID=2975634 RepID=UPI0032455F09
MVRDTLAAPRTKPGGGADPFLGNALVAGADHRDQAGGNGYAVHVFATTSFQVPEDERIKSVTLPRNLDLHIFATGLG